MAKILQMLKALPLLAWGALVWAFETGPEEIGSKTSHWAKWFGYPDLPGYILTKSTDAYVLAGGIFLAVLYVLLVWVWPWWRKNYPRLVPFQAKCPSFC